MHTITQGVFQLHFEIFEQGISNPAPQLFYCLQVLFQFRLVTDRVHEILVSSVRSTLKNTFNQICQKFD